MTHEYGLLLALSTAFFWGIAPILNKRALREMGLWKANALRGVGILVMLAPVYFFADAGTITELMSLNARTYLVLAMIAIINNIVGDIFYLAAIRDIGASLAAPITSSYPLGVVLSSWLLFGEALSFSVLVGTLSVVTGLAMLNIRPAESRGAENSRHLRGVAAAVLAALCWILGLTLTKYLTNSGVTPTAITFWRGLIFGPIAIAFLPFEARGKPAGARVSAAGFLAAACSGLASLVAGTWLFSNSILIIPMSVATPIASSSPLIAAGFACAFMGEKLRPIQWLGIVFVVGGAIAVNV